jgi:crossover junction endodeoxyribonuclease RusA
MKIILPWPPKALHPNARVHWAVRSKAVKSYREMCYWAVKALGVVPVLPEGKLHFWLDFFPPDNRRRDDDGMLSAFKSGRDGIADALRIDDNRFVTHIEVKDAHPKDGMVWATITGGPVA